TAWPHQDPPKHIGAAANSDDYAGISYGAIPFTLVFNISWNPAASIPCGFDGRGMPVGLQVVGGMDDDATVLRACRAFETARPWTGRRPTVS
ncbi:MAG: amidase family protein, partial [Dehalococcoidia bacterium]